MLTALHTYIHMYNKIQHIRYAMLCYIMLWCSYGSTYVHIYVSNVMNTSVQGWYHTNCLRHLNECKNSWRFTEMKNFIVFVLFFFSFFGEHYVSCFPSFYNKNRYNNNNLTKCSYVYVCLNIFKFKSFVLLWLWGKFSNSLNIFTMLFHSLNNAFIYIMIV